MAVDQRKAAFGALARARRKQLHLTQPDVHALGGPAPATQRAIEGGRFGSLRLGTTWPLERVFGWRPGAINAYLERGGEIEIAIEPDYDALRSTGSLTPLSDDAVGPSEQDASHVLLDLPDEVLEGLTEVEREEVRAAARLAALSKAREIRGG